VEDLTAVSLFAGVGGFDEAFRRAGITVTASVEIDVAAKGVLADRLPTTTLFDDVREVTGDQLRATGFVPGRGILSGGFPCQDLSVAGRRAGLVGERSSLFHQIARLAAELKPRYLLLENVPGLLSSHGGRDMGTVLGTLGDLGYRWAYRVLDAQFFGVPQRRRRVFIVGSSAGGADPAEILFESEGRGRHLAPSADKRKVVAALTADGVGTCGADDNQAQAGHLIPVECVTGQVTHSLTSEGADASEDGTGRGTPMVATFVKARRAGENNPSPESWRESGTLPTLAGHSTTTTAAIVHADQIVRRLMPIECERLQGFPDNWTATSWGVGQKDSARYRQLGNAVAVPVVEWIARRLVAADTHAHMEGADSARL
jgi:DNA (cytosine-5)-methyltransferase 1